MKKINIMSVITVISCISAFYFYYNPRDTNDNTLTINLLTLTHVLHKADEDEKIPKFNVAYTYDGRAIEELFFAEFIITNNSFSDFTKDDFINPLQFKTNANILNVIVETSKNCSIKIKSKENQKIIFTKNIFKQNEYIKVILYLDSKPILDFSGNSIVNLNNRDIEVDYAGRSKRRPQFPVGGWYLPNHRYGWPNLLFSESSVITH